MSRLKKADYIQEQIQKGEDSAKQEDLEELIDSCKQIQTKLELAMDELDTIKLIYFKNNDDIDKRKQINEAISYLNLAIEKLNL